MLQLSCEHLFFVANLGQANTSWDRNLWFYLAQLTLFLPNYGKEWDPERSHPMHLENWIENRIVISLNRRLRDVPHCHSVVENEDNAVADRLGLPYSWLISP
ncbi:MAG: hypothetical protein OHK0012_02000 [Synechococcales cyanobacterium]